MATSNTSIETQIQRGDLSLFATIESQSTERDKRSLLALHAACRARWNKFNYLEIGSHLGGSLQALAADPACQTIISVDPRPTAFADQRGIVSAYPENSTARMMDLLKKVPGANIAKIETIDSDTRTIQPKAIQCQPHLCFIDGEHTDIAALRDARFCLNSMGEEGCIAFHDANVVYAAINTFLLELEAAGRPFQAYLLPDAVFVVEIGEINFKQYPSIQKSLSDAWKGYISGLQENVWYRAVLNKPLFKFLRRIRFVRRIFVVKNFSGGQPI